MAGFRAEEYAMARAILDSVGASAVKVLPATDEMLAGPVSAAVRADELDWSAPRPADWIRGGAWGSQRVVLFSGLPVAAQVGRAAPRGATGRGNDRARAPRTYKACGRAWGGAAPHARSGADSPTH